MLTVTVKMSFRYISTGSAALLAEREGRRRRRRRQDRVDACSNASSKSRLISVRTFCALQVIGVVIAGREHIGADHDAALDLRAEAGGAGLLVHVDDVAGRRPRRP